MPEPSMTDTTAAGGVEAARTLRELVAEEAADSERARTLNARTVGALWESGLMTGESVRGRRDGAELRRDDRHLDRVRLAGRLPRLDRHRQPAVGGGLCRLPPPRRVR